MSDYDPLKYRTFTLGHPDGHEKNNNNTYLTYLISIYVCIHFILSLLNPVAIISLQIQSLT